MFQPYNHTSNLSFSKTPACSEISLNLLAATEALRRHILRHARIGNYLLFRYVKYQSDMAKHDARNVAYCRIKTRASRDTIFVKFGEISKSAQENGFVTSVCAKIIARRPG